MGAGDPLRDLEREALRITDPERSLLEADGPDRLSGTHRASPLLLVSSTLGGLGVAAVALVTAALRLDGPDPASVAVGVGVALLVLALTVAGSLVMWHTRTWELSDEGVVLRSGVLTRRRLQVPYEHIHTVNSSSTFLERALGLVTLDLDTGAAEAEGDATTIRGLQAGMARELRDELFRRKAAALSGGAAAVPGPAEPAGEAPLATYVLDARELLLAALSESRVAAQAAALVVLVVEGANLLQDLRVVDLNALAGEAGGLPAGTVALGATALVAVALLAGFVVSVLAGLASYAGFRAQRFRDRVVVERGLLSRSSHTVALDRVQVVRVSQGLLRQLIGYAEVRALVVAAPGGDEDSSTAQGIVLHPFVRTSEVDRFLARMLPPYAGIPDEADLARLPPAAGRRQALRTCAAVLATGLACAAPGVVAALLPGGGAGADALAAGLVVVGAVAWAACTARLVAGAVLRLRDSRAGHSGRHLALVRGGARRDVYVASRSHLQHATVSATPFQGRAGVATFRARTAAAGDLVLRDLARADADELLAWVRPRG